MHMNHQPCCALRARKKTATPVCIVDRTIACPIKKREPAGTQRQPHRNQQTLFISIRVCGLRNNRGAAWCYGASPRDFNWVRHGFDCCHHLFSLCHHWRYVARQPASASRAACLVSKCSLYRTGRVFISAIGPAIDHLSSSTDLGLPICVTLRAQSVPAL